MSIRKHFNYLLTAEGGGLCEYILCEKNNDDKMNDEEMEAVIKDRRKSQGESCLVVNGNQHVFVFREGSDENE